MRKSRLHSSHALVRAKAGLRTRPLAIAIVSAVAAIGVAACGSSSTTSAPNASGGGSAASGSGSSSAAPGVTSKTISLGLDVAQSGQAAPLTVPFIQGIQTYWDRQNAVAHGVCGRSVKLVFGDNGGDPQTMLTAYTAMQNKILAMQQASPASTLAPLVSHLQQAQMLFSSSSTINLFNLPEYFGLSTDFGHAVVDTIYWLTQHKGLKKGDSVGFLYGTGGSFNEAILGAKYAAQTYGVKLVPEQLSATDTDMSGPVSAFKSANAKYVILYALAPQDFDALSAAQAANYHPTFVAASFLASALTTSAGPALKSNNFYVIGNGGNVASANLSDNTPGVRQAVAAYRTYFHKAPDNPAVLYGYAQAWALEQILAASCANGTPLTRASVLKGFASIKTMTTGGLLPTLDFSTHQVNKPPSLEIFLSRVDTGVLGSLKRATPNFAAPQASGFDLHGS